MLRLLILLALLAVPAFGQDTTCDAGDIAWVKDTVNGDEGHTLGGASAEYNNFAAPFGLQAVYDEACDGLLVRIVDGANDYGSASTSWNNRDADKAILLNNGTWGNGLVAGSVDSTGWLDETTQCLAWTQTDCPIVIDFATGTGHGFVSQNTNVSFRQVHVKNVENISFAMTQNHNTLYQVIVEGGEGNALQETGDRHIYVDNIFRTNGATDNQSQLSVKSFSVHYRNAIHDCGTGTASETGLLYTGGAKSSFMFTLVDECNNPMLNSSSGTAMYMWETYHGTGGASGESVVKNSGTGFGAMIFFSILANSGTTSPDDDAVESASASPYQALVGNFYNDITGDQYSNAAGEPSPLYDPDDAENNNAPVTDCELELNNISNGSRLCAWLTVDFWPTTLVPTAESFAAGAVGGARAAGGGSNRVPTHVIGALFDGMVKTDD